MKYATRLRVIFLISSMVLFLVTSVSASDLPAPPENYQWQENIETKTAFLVPQDWFFKTERQGETFGYFISKEKIENYKYDTGLMVNVIPKVTQNLNIPPSQYMLTFIKETIDRTTKVEKQWEQNYGPFKGVGLNAIMGDEHRGWRQHALFVANDQTGTLYLVIFESPIVLWDETWPIAEPILKKLYMDTEY